VPRRSPSWTDMHLIWHSRRGRRLNHLWQIFWWFWWSVNGCRFCGGSKIAIYHWQSQSPLTQGWRYRAAFDTYIHKSAAYNGAQQHPIRWCVVSATSPKCKVRDENASLRCRDMLTDFDTIGTVDDDIELLYSLTHLMYVAMFTLKKDVRYRY